MNADWIISDILSNQQTAQDGVILSYISVILLKVGKHFFEFEGFQNINFKHIFTRERILLNISKKIILVNKKFDRSYP